jgi:hypothetical protein
MDNLLKHYLKTAETYSTNYTGNVMINVPDVTLKNMTVTGDLVIGDGVGDGNVTLDSVVVTGRTVIRGGGVHSIRIIGASNLQNIIIARVNGQVRVYSGDGAQIGDVIVDGNDDVIIEGNVGTVTITAPDITVTATNADIKSAVINGGNSTIIVGTNSTIKTVTAAADNVTITASAGSTIENIVVNNNGAKINGTGDVGTVAANANNVTVTTPGTSVAAATGTTGVTAGGDAVAGGTSDTIPEIPVVVPPVVTPPASSGGGGGSVTVAVSAITVTGADTVVNGGTLQMSAAITPANATNQTIAWTVAPGTGAATISASGVLTATALGTVTVTATNAASGVTGIKVLTITAVPVTAVPVSAITVTGFGDATTITTDNGTLQMLAAVGPADASNKAVIWSVTNGSGTATISTDGLLTALTNGTVTVKATSVSTPSVNGTAGITISNQLTAATFTAIDEPVTENGITYQRYALTVTADNTPIDLNTTDITGMTVLNPDASTTTLTVTVDSDPLLWFNVAKASGDYVCTITTANGTVYTATINHAPTAIATATIAIPAPVIDEMPETPNAEGTGFTGTISWTSPESGDFVAGTPKAIVVLTADSGYTFTGMAAIGAVTIAGSTSATYVVSGTNGETLTITVGYAALVAAPVTLSSIEVKTPATKLVYTVGDTLDIAGLVIEGTYSNSNTALETITAANVTGFDSTTVVASQTLTVTVGGQTTTYTVEIQAAPVAVSAITVTGAGNATTVVNGGTLQMSAAITPANATNKTVTWSVAAGTGSATIDATTEVLTATGVGTVTVTATADDGSGITGTKVITVPISVGTESELVSAITSASAVDIIQLTGGITLSTSQKISNKAITIDMNGFNISGNPDLSAPYHYAFKVVLGGDLTLDNTSDTLSKLLVGTGQAEERMYRGIRIDLSGKATVKANVSIETGLPVMVYGNGVAGSAQLDVYGKLMVSVRYDTTSAYATISGNGTAGYGGTIINIYDGAEVINPYDVAMSIPQDGVVNVYGGTITGATAIGIKSGTLNISGGTLRATGQAIIPTPGWSDGINASGCTVQIESNDAYSGDIVVNITGGTIISGNGYALYEYLDLGNTDTEVTSINIANATIESALPSAKSRSMLISQKLYAASASKIIIDGSGVFIIAADVEITAFDAISNVAAGTAGAATYANAAAVQAVLPTTATANTSAVTVPVTAWVDTDTYNPAAAGSYTFTATLGTIPAGFANTGGYTATVEVVVN